MKTKEEIKEKILKENNITMEILKIKTSKIGLINNLIEVCINTTIKENSKRIKMETINNAIAHLNGYKAILETKFNILPLAVDDTIKELKELKTKWKN